MDDTASAPSSVGKEQLQIRDEEESMVIEVEAHGLEWWECVTLCLGFLMNSYQLFITGSVSALLSTVYGEVEGESEALIGVSLAGPIFGMILFGFLCDRYGAHRMFIVCSVVQLLSSAASSFVFPINPDSDPASVAQQLWVGIAVCRFINGVGVGGEYPVVAILTAEKCSEERRGLILALVLSMQGLGVVMAPFVVWCLTYTQLPFDWVWRLSFGVGTILQILVVIPRLYIKPSDHWFEIRIHTAKPFNQWLIATKKILRKSLSKLLGASFAWLLFDITFYGNSFFKDEAINFLKLNEGSTKQSRVLHSMEASMIIAAVGLPDLNRTSSLIFLLCLSASLLTLRFYFFHHIPYFFFLGFIIAIALVERVGRKKLQFAGFMFMIITFLAVGLALDSLLGVPSVFLVVYGLTFLVSNLGPNTTTFVVPAEIFPTEIRGIAFGICGAFGKLGAIIGAVLFEQFGKTVGSKAVFITCAVVAFFGIVVTYAFVPEKTGKPLKHFRQRRDSIQKLLVKQEKEIFSD